MSRTKGTFTLTSNIEPKVGAPLDARTIVKLKNDLTANGTFEYPYIGLTVFVTEENKKYTLIGADPTVAANWREEGSGTTTTADHVTYDNTESGLDSTNVQDAIDEIVNSIVDEKVKQTPDTTNSNFEVLFSGTADNTEHIEGTKKTTTLRFNPFKGALMEGNNTSASGNYSHAEGSGTTANDDYTHAEGYNTSAVGLASHVEGYNSIAAHNYTHAEGYYTCANGTKSHAEGEGSVTSERAAHAEGLESTASGIASHSEGYRGLASGNGAHAEGGYASSGDLLGTFATGENSHAEGYLTTASGNYSHAEGSRVLANNVSSHAEGQQTTAQGSYSHAEGNYTYANGTDSHAEGYKTSALAYASHAEGYNTITSTDFAHAEGSYNSAIGKNSHAEGNYTCANGINSHTEGYLTKANSADSHAEGSYTYTSGASAHAEGYNTTASGKYSHAAGEGTCAAGQDQTVVGKYNVADTTSLFIVGNGTNSTRSNALKVASDGTTTLGASGSITSGNTQAVTGGAVYTALSNKLDASLKGTANGVAELGSDGKVPSAQLPTIPAAQIQSDYTQNDNTKLDYIKNKPTLGTAAAKNVPSSGNASTTEVVMGDDTRLTDSRNAKDVYSWAKASTKPTYTASEVGAIATTVKGVANGVAELDSAGKVPSSQLPSYVDDVIEVDDYAHLPITGESGKIYVTKDTDKTYRWSGTGYTEISPSLALGETSSTAYRGDRGKTAYDHATETKLSTATASGFYKVAGTAQGHIASLTAVTKADITALGIPGSDTNTTYSLTQDGTDGHKITLTPSSGSAQTVTIPDNNTTYSLTQDSSDGHKITLTPSSGTTQTITIPDNNTHRPIQVNGTQNLGDNTTALNLKNGTNVTVTADGGNVTIATSAEVNQNAFSNVKVGSTTVAADSKTDTLELVAGDNITLTPDATNDKITIAATVPTVNNATLTIQKNGTTVKTFTANASTDVTANITVPTKVSELTNDSGYTTNTGTVTSVATGAGLTGGTITGSGTIKAYMKSETKATYDSNTVTNTQNRQYAVTPDKTGYLSVNVPWENTQYTAATAAPGNIATSGAVGTSTNYARQDHTHGISLATGDSNGQVKIAGSNVSVKGWDTKRDVIYKNYQSGFTTNTWYRLFRVSYSSWNYFNYRITVKCGYMPLYEVLMTLRFTSSGISSNETYCKIITSSNSSDTVKNSFRIYQIDDTTFGVAALVSGATSELGFEILDMSREGTVDMLSYMTVDEPFLALNAAPTAFGNHIVISGSYNDLADRPNVNNVTQTADNSSSSDSYELLISNSANNTTENAGVRKSSRLRFNPSNGRVTMQGPLIVRATDGAGSYDEGIRINAGKNGYSSLVLGGSQDSVSGTGVGQFWIGTNSTNTSYKKKLYIAHNGSIASNTYFYVSGDSDVSPYLNLGSSGSVTSGNTQAVTGGVVYTALTSGSARDNTKLPLAGGTLTNTDNVFYTANNTSKITVNAASILQSPVPKYLWHDLFAFCRFYTTKYYTTSDNSTWTEATLNKDHFAQKDSLSINIIAASGKCGSRWTWTASGSSPAWSNGVWLVIGCAYQETVATITILFESSSDGTTWTTRHNSTHNGGAAPIWCKLDTYGGDSYLRLTITKDKTDTTKTFNIGAIKLLSTRWGDQGLGSEYESPYDWTNDGSIYPLGNGVANLGGSSRYWKNIYATTFNGALNGNASTATSATKATQDSDGNVINSTYLKLAGGTMTGDIIFNKTGATDLTQVRMKCGTNDYGRIAAGATASNSGYLELATADAGNEPIYARQYSGVYTSLQRTATLLDGSGNTEFPKKLTSKIMNNFKTGTGYPAEDKGSSADPRYFPARWSFNFGQNPSDGDVICVKLPCAGHDWGDFISTDNGTTYKPVALWGQGTGRMTTHYGINSYMEFVYDATGQVNDVFAATGANARSNVSGGCWRVVNFYDTNTYDRNRYTGTIKCGTTAIVAGNIIVGKDGVYHHLKDGTVFDITYPILYAASNISANGTSDNNYDILYIGITTTQSITLTAYQPVYIKGTLSGVMFTPYQAACLTQTVSTSNDGYVYIYLGTAINASAIYLQERHPIYAFKYNRFAPLTELATYTSLLKPVSSNTTTNFSNWNIPSGSYQVWGQQFSDNRLKYTPSGGSETTVTDTGDWTMWLTGNGTSNTATLNMRIDGTFYATTFNGNLSGNASTATSATKATQDSDGNAINTTYLKKSGGTITGALALNGDLQLKPASSSSNDSPDIVWYYGNGQEKARLWTADTYSAASGLTYRLYKSDGTSLHSGTIPLSDTKNTAGSTDTSSKIFLIGATSQAANPQTYSDDQVYVTSGTLQTNITNAAAGINANTANSSTAGGVSLYSTDPTAYGVIFRGTGNQGKHGYVQGDWATYFTMTAGSGVTNRGWVFRDKTTTSNVASISNGGNAAFKGSVTVGANETNTSGARMEFNSTNKCVDFVFV